MQSDINTDELEDLVEKEMKMMDEAIRLAASKIEVSSQKLCLEASHRRLLLQEILQKNREEASGVRLEVNEKILDACTALMRVRFGCVLGL